MRTFLKTVVFLGCSFLIHNLSDPLFSQDLANVMKKDISSGWQYRQVGGIQWNKASVPGCIHLDLLNNHSIKDPYFGNNETELQWIENKDWEYQTYFDVDSILLSKKHISLVFEGLDTYAKVYLNGYFLLDADNMFRSWEADCKKYLKKGKNQLFIRFASSVRIGKEKTIKYTQSLPGGVGVFTRKAAYQFGWDWGPRFVTCGINKPVYLRAWDRTRIKNIDVIQHSVNEKKAEYTAVFSLGQPLPRQIILSVKDNTHGLLLAEKVVNPVNDESQSRLDFTINNPKLWWTNGLGEPYLYHLSFEIKSTDNRFLDSLGINIGVRTIELVQDTDSIGRSFYFKLNGIPVFMKGANYIPPDNFLPRVTDDNYSEIIAAAKEANMNMLRVWGGGSYEKDKFYDLCDKNGILVWQDFMFACAIYPEGNDFIENIKEEAIQNIIRLRNHACLALWCGNNEIDEGWHNWGWQKQYHYSSNDSAAIWNNYVKIFQEMLPGLVSELDSAKPYVSSSPQIGWGRSESMTQGDSHYWGVWWGAQPFEIFKEKVPRFMSEFGFQSFPDSKTITAVTTPDQRYLYSDVLKTHQKHPTGFELIRQYMKCDYHIPDSLNDYIYVSQLLQAEGITLAIEAQRRAKPYCMGSLYWQLNDCWPVVSWSGLDYYGRRKALHYFARKVFSPLLISATEDKGWMKIFLVSDKLHQLTGNLQLRLTDFDGNVIKDTLYQTEISSNTSQCVYDYDLDKLTGKLDKRKILMECLFFTNDTLAARNLHFFVPPKELNLPDSKVNYIINPSNDGFRITLTTNKLAKNIFLDFDGADGFFSDNYFDMVAGDKMVIYFHTKNHQPVNPALVNKNSLKIITLKDTYSAKNK